MRQLKKYNLSTHTAAEENNERTTLPTDLST